MRRIVIIGNSGSGKSTMAQRLAAEHSLPHLDLDTLAWSATAVRRPLEESATLLSAFVDAHPEWVIEGCYASLLERALRFASELRFLNPGVEACVENCRRRPWEPHKYASKEEQDARLDFLLSWVRDYGVRDDEYSLAAHRQLFDRFAGEKREHTRLTA
jgi:adenylate kinase family enzyme